MNNKPDKKENTPALSNKEKTFKWLIRIVKIVLITALSLVFAGLLFVLSVNFGLFGKLPSKGELRKIRNPLASEVFTADNVLMGKYYIQNRQDIKPGEITAVMVNALVATEDARFFEHDGIDYRSLGRVFFKSILLQKSSSGGGSTITQQLAKNIYKRKDYGFLSIGVNKIKEMLTARRIEKAYTKEEIIALYLSTVPFGESTFGIKSAASRYFNKNTRELKTEEVAVLIGMLKATGYYNPVLHQERAKMRRNTALSQMEKYGYVDKEKADSLKNIPLELQYSPLPHFGGLAPYFREKLRLELADWCSKNKNDSGDFYNLYTDGLRIYTTIDSRMQKYARESVNDHLQYLQKIFDRQWPDKSLWKSNASLRNFIEAKKQSYSTKAKEMLVFNWDGEKEVNYTSMDSLQHFLSFLQAGFLAMDVSTGDVKAWVGGIDHKYFKYDHVTSKRQVGSTFKPFVYLAAIENDVHPCDFFPNDSIVYEENENWTPRNADRKYGGFYSLKGALTHSVNTVSVDVFMKTGYKNVKNIVEKAGIESELPNVPSLALGSAEASLLEMVNAYQAIANGGIYCRYQYLDRIEDKYGNVLFERSSNIDGAEITDRKNAEIITAMLQNVVNKGTAASLRSGYKIYSDVAGKTGTTQEGSDGWFIGFSPTIVAGAWVGGELPGIRFRSSGYGQGAVAAMPIFANFMGKVYNNREFAHLKSETFSISDDTRNMMECEDFRENKPFLQKPIRAIKNLNFFQKLFGKKKKKDKEKKKDL